MINVFSFKKGESYNFYNNFLMSYERKGGFYSVVYAFLENCACPQPPEQCT